MGIRLFILVLIAAVSELQLNAAATYEELFQQAAAFAQNGNYQGAIENYQQALRLRPNAPDALNNLAAMYYQTHRYSEAYGITAKLWRDHPEMVSAALIAGLAAVQCQRYRDAFPPLEQVLKANAANRDAMLGLASAHIGLNQLAEAEGYYFRLTNQSGNDVEALYGLAICYEQEAENASRRLAQMPGGKPYFNRLLGEYLLATGGAQLAKEAFGEAASPDTDATTEAARQFALARTLAEKSQDAFARFVALAPDSWQAALFRGDVERQRGNLQGALAQYQLANQKQPENAASLLGMGTVYWQLGEFDRAQSSLRDALKINPQASQAWFELGNIAIRQHHEVEAIPLLKKFLAMQPEASAAHADLGRAYLHLGQFEQAVQELSQGLGTDTNGEVHYELATAFNKLGRKTESQAEMQKSNQLRRAALARDQKLREQR